MGLKKNILNNFILTVSNVLAPLVTFPYITRVLSPRSLGDMMFIDAFSQYFILFSSLGIPFYGIREVAKNKGDKDKISKLVIDLIILQGCLAIFSVIIFFILGITLSKLENLRELIWIAISMIMASTFLIEWFYQGIEEFSYITKRSIIIKLLSVVLILVAVKKSSDAFIYYSILATVLIINAVINFLFFLRNHFTSYKLKKSILQHLKPLLILFSINVSVSVYVILDSIILGLLTDSINVSLYNVPLRIVKIYWTIIAGVGLVFIPRISIYFKEKDFVSIRSLMEKSISLVLIFGIPFCFFCIAFPEQILILIAGEKFVEAKNALIVLAPIPLVIGLCNIFGTQFLLPIGKERFILYATIIGLCLSVSINLLLIPTYKFVGAAVAAFCAELAVCLYIYWRAIKVINIKVDIYLCAQLLLSCILTILINLFTEHYFAGFWQIIINAIVYILVFSGTQLFYMSEIILVVIKKIK